MFYVKVLVAYIVYWTCEKTIYLYPYQPVEILHLFPIILDRT